MTNAALSALAIVLAVATLSAAPASATLIGDTVVLSGAGVPGSPRDLLVGAGSEIIFNDGGSIGTGADDYIEVDISGSTIRLDLTAQLGGFGWNPAGLSNPFSFVFDSLNWVDDLTATIASISTTVFGSSLSNGGASALTLTKPDPVMLKIIDPPDAQLFDSGQGSQRRSGRHVEWSVGVC